MNLLKIRKLRMPLVLCLSGLFATGCSRPEDKSGGSNASEKSGETEMVDTWEYHRDDMLDLSAFGRWPALGGAYLNSFSSAEDLKATWEGAKPPFAWSVEIGSGYSVPVVGEDELYVFHRVGDEEFIDCRNLETGELRWQFGQPTAYECEVAYSNGPYSTPALDEERLYALGTESKLYCLRRSDGELVWIRYLQDEYEPEAGDFPVGSSPLVVGDKVFVNLGGTKGKSTVVAFDKLSGEPLWTALDDGRSYATPRYAKVAGVEHLLIFSDKYLSSLNPENGEVRWQVEFGVKKSPNRVNAVSPLVVGNKVIATAGPGRGAICLLLQPDGSQREVWQIPRNLDSQFNNIVSVNDLLFGFTSKWNRQAQFRCINLSDGEIRWEWPAELGRGSIAVADGKFYLLGEEGNFAVLDIDANEPQMLYRSTEPLLDGPTYSAPVIVGGQMILRNEKQLISIDLQP